MLMIAQVGVFQGEGLNENFETKMATLVFLVGKFWLDCDSKNYFITELQC